MGMSHHWQILRPFTVEEWKHLCAEARRIVAAAEGKGIPLAGPDGAGEPVVDTIEVALNGKRPRHCEAFILDSRPRPPRVPGTPRWEFCKTASQPYDRVVLTLLAAAREVAPGAINVESDAGNEAIRKHL
jgi:hypothetical protein